LRRLAGIVAVVLLAGCTKVGTENAQTATSAGGRHSWTQPGVLRIAIQAGPNTMNPLLAGNTTEAMLTRLTNDVLVSVDQQGREVPMLAADCVSRERREGTLGLLFLTPLDARGIMLAKSMVHHLA